MRRLSLPLVGLLLALSAAASGCRQGTFLGNRYDNFRAYYNTFYNAQKSFETGEEQLVQLDQPVNRSRFLSVFADVPAESGAAGATAGAGSTSGPFEDAIEKSADLLRERPSSKWADDALLLIGKAYFYQRNLVGAEAKFRETMAAAEAREQGALVDEARFWLGRTLAAQQRYDEATSTFTEALAREGLSRHWRARLQLALAEQYVQRRAWTEAAAALEAGLPDIRDNDIAGRASFLLGQVREAGEDYDGAAAAYAAVERYRPYYPLLYAAQLNRALVLGLDADRPEEALDLIRRMRRDDKHFENRAEVELAYARLLAASGRPDEARERFETLLYSDEFTGTAVPRSDVQYYYGAFYRDDRNDFLRAAAYLDTAATGLRADPGRGVLVTRAALTGVRREADAFLEYAGIATRLAEADSLLELGTLDDAAFAARIAGIEAERRRVWEEEQRRLARLRTQSAFEGGAVAGLPGEDDPFGEGRNPSGDPGGPNPPAPAEAGFLNYRDVSRLQDAFVSFQTVWGDRQLVENWRRNEAIGGVVAQNNPDYGTSGDGPVGRSPGGPPPLDITVVPRTPEALTRVTADRAGLRYELGNVLFLGLARPDSAAYWYGLVVEEHPDEDVAARALYALAEVRREQGRTADAEALYRRLLDTAPEGALAEPARARLGLPSAVRDGAPEAAGLAVAAYEQAYADWQRGAHAEALRGFLALAVTFPDTDQAPRALVAAAETFAEWAQRDTQPDTVYLEAGIPAALVPPALFDTLAALSPPPALRPAVVPTVLDAEAPEAEAAEPEEEPGEAESPADKRRRLERLRREGEPLNDEGLDDEELDDEGLDDELEGLFGEDEEGELPDDAGPPDGLPAELDDEEGLLPGLSDPDAEGAYPDTTGGVETPPADPQPPNDGDAREAQVPADSLEAPAEASSLPADTTVADATAADTTAADSIATPVLGLSDLLWMVEARYPNSPYVARAQTLRTAFLNLQGFSVDTGPSPSGDASAPLIGLPAAPPDAALPPGLAGIVPPETFGLEGDAPFNDNVGGYAWRMAAVSEPRAAYALLRTYAARGLRVAVAQEPGEGEPRYAVLLGQFDSVAAAEAVRDALPEPSAEEDPRVVALLGLRLLDERALELQQGSAPDDAARD